MPSNPLPLKDIHLPEAIGWWPPAFGWWLLAIFITAMSIFVIWLHKRLTRKTAIKTAKKFLSEIKQDNNADNHKKLNDISVLLRRVAISVAPRTKSASLTGQAWLNFLDSSLKSAHFSEGVGRHLIDGPYRKAPPDDLEISQLISLCEDWLKTQNTQK